MRKCYLGDGIFAEADHGRVKIKTDTAAIFLEPEVLAAFQYWLRSLEGPAHAAARRLAGQVLDQALGDHASPGPKFDDPLKEASKEVLAQLSRIARDLQSSS